MRKISLLLVLSFALLCPSLTLAWEGKVTEVTDGDTIKVTRDGEEFRVRLYGIDTPETDQPHGEQATEYVEPIEGRTVSVEMMDKDQYGRVVGIVEVEGRNVNEELVRDGHAWVYDRYCKADFCDDWKSLQDEARNADRGLWSAPDPTPPWEWRRQ